MDTSIKGYMSLSPEGHLLWSSQQVGCYRCPLSLTSVYQDNGIINCTVAFESYSLNATKLNLQFENHTFSTDAINDQTSMKVVSASEDLNLQPIMHIKEEDDASYIQHGLIFFIITGEERPQCYLHQSLVK
ncbi:unnamed protein product [Soboliphyme baturini]|uniref:Uncharacterized protein n=1 Tax=Soboliphyme baturini TaxID=241478 RepID=A0A183IXQ4_9BILA|nr:unnamed protein product [Soboliphyme baturini]